VKISASYYSHRGGRATNEDSITLMENQGSVVAIVADGLGGEGGGDIASQSAVKTISGELAGGEATVGQIASAISRANDEIIKLQKAGGRMKTTIALLYLSAPQTVAVHIGDTRIYHFRSNRIIYQSTDHTVSQMAVNAGEISANDIRNHIDRNKLTNALGARVTALMDITGLHAKGGDAFLLCSDGFWECILEAEMCEDLSTSNNADEWLHKMRGRVDSRMTPTSDNHSAIAIIR
jgi:serine/threonine protein phosphatase PrpC